MAWEEVVRIPSAWIGKDTGGSGALLWKADLVLQINIKSVNEDTRVVTYDLRMFCDQTGGTADKGTSNSNELWIGPAENIPPTKDSVGSYRSGIYYKNYPGVITWTDGKTTPPGLSPGFSVSNLTETYNTDGTLSKAFGIAAWTGTFTFVQNRTTYNFPVQSFGGKLSIKTGNNTWSNGQVYIKTDDSTWSKAKAVWVKTGDSTWSKAK